MDGSPDREVGRGRSRAQEYVRPDREFYRDRLHTLINSKAAHIPHDEEEIEDYLHIIYDDYDPKEELMKELWCEEVVDYLLSTFDKKDIRGILFRMKIGDDNKICPIRAVARNFSEKSIDTLHVICDRIAEIYLRNSMEDEYRATRFAFEEVYRDKERFRVLRNYPDEQGVDEKCPKK